MRLGYVPTTTVVAVVVVVRVYVPSTGGAV